MPLNESHIEEAALTWFGKLGYSIEAITANSHPFRTLATLRDTLLPKFLSGELFIPSKS